MTPPASTNVVSILVRVVGLIAVVVAATWAAHAVRDALDLTIMPSSEQQVHTMLMAGMIAYIGLLAMPFVPGAEIGIAMLAAFGASIAPLVYVSTVAAMMLAYVLGHVLPPQNLERLLRLLRLSRAADLIARAGALPPEARLAVLLDAAPPRTVGLALRHRYIALGLIVNMPGNVVIGGGGGIMLLAGLSRVFTPLSTFVTVAIAVSPVPLAIFLFGA